MIGDLNSLEQLAISNKREFNCDRHKVSTYSTKTNGKSTWSGTYGLTAEHNFFSEVAVFKELKVIYKFTPVLFPKSTQVYLT